MNSIREFKEILKTDVAIAGGKGASLGEMTNANISVPKGFVVLSEAFEEFIKKHDLNVEIDAILDKVNTNAIDTVEKASEQIKSLIINAEIPEDIKKQIISKFKELNTKYVAVRSSATSEDSASAAWAGQLDTFLNTTKKDLLENVKKCWASLFTPRAIFYRFEQKLEKSKISVAVIVQKMIESEESGIAFSVHPVTQDRNQLIIEAGFGLGEAIVSGQITPDSYVVDKQDWHIINININEQTKGIYKKKNGGNEWKELGEKGEKQVLNKDEIIELAKLIVNIENHYGFPIDVEWAKENGKFYIVQSRPITTLKDVRIKGKKIMVNLQSREHSLIYCYVWQKSNQELSGDFFHKVKNLLFINNGFGKTSAWYEGKELDKIFDETGRKTNSDKKYFNQVKKEFYKYYNKLIDYIKGNKEIKSLSDLQDYYDLYIQWWSTMAVMYVLPESKSAKKTIQDAALKIRSETEKYSDENDRFLIENFNRICPKHKSISHLMTPEEMFQCNKILDKNTINKIKEREKGYVLFNGKLYDLDKLESLLSKNNLILKKEEIKVKDSLKGSTAFPGHIKAKVRVIKSKKQLSNLLDGEVLVTEMTSPDYVPYMKKASAIITDEGGVVCHTAIVARELKKPCIIGTKVATKLLKDGDLVEVDADKGVVRILKKIKDESLFIKAFTRDYSLLMLDVWYKGEAYDKKPYSRERQEFLPYIIFIREDGTVKSYYDNRGIDWITNHLKEQLKKSSFLKDLEKNVKEKLKLIRPIYENEKPLSKKNLLKFIENFEEAYPWIEAMWMLCHMKDDKLIDTDISDIIKLRKQTEKLAGGTDIVTRKSLKKIFPKIKDYVHVLKIDEIKSGKIPHLSELQKRDNGFIYTENEMYLGKDRKFIEDKYNIKLKEEEIESLDKIKGNPAYKGIIKGKVKRLMGYKDIENVKKGEIIVSPMTMPDFLPAMKKASGIITDEGGINCHASIVAREMKKPCIVGTKIATQILKDGDLIEVDANKGIVRILKK